MQLGMIGLGRMGAGMAARLVAAGVDCVVHDRDAAAVRAAERHGAAGADSVAGLVAALPPPRAVWLMVPAGAVDAVLDTLVPLLTDGDIVVDGGNSRYTDSMRRAAALEARGIRFVDVGTSGGVFGPEAGYCLMIGGAAEAVAALEPAFAALVTGTGARAARLHCGPSGAGHFVKMVHNGIEYGLMQAYAEGLNLLEEAPEHDLDVAAIAELWRHGSVVRSWLLDLTAGALAGDPRLAGFDGHVADSGEGRWMLETAVAQRVPVPALAAALFARFGSRGRDSFANRALAAMRKAFGGHGSAGDA